MQLNNLKDSDIESDSNESYSEEEPSKNKSIKQKRKYEAIPTTDAPKSKKKHKNDLYKPPTVEELNNLRETENLFNNNLFRLQIDELLTEIKIKAKRKTQLTNWLQNFTSSIEKLPSNETILSDLLDIKVDKKDRLLNNLLMHENLFKTDQDIKLTFSKPEEIQYFGLYENDALPGPNITLNINLVMPKSCFLLKDYLNNRYIVKRYYYLLYIVQYLKKSDLASSLKVCFYENNNLLPIIEITPKDISKTSILILVTPSEGAFKPVRFLPQQNNCKLDLFDEGLDTEVLKTTGTIFYNSLLAHDVTLHTNNEFLKTLLRDQTNIQDGIKLLCIWLKQRELNVGIGSFTENILLYLVSYLLLKKKINKLMSSYQIIRNFWSFLTMTDLSIEPISLGNTTKDVLKDFKDNYSIVILDKTGCYNVASNLNAEMYKKVKYESQIALKYLDDNRNNSFHDLFLTKYPFHLQYDAVIDLTKSIKLDLPCNATQQQKCLHIGYKNVLTYNLIKDILRKGLNKRIINLVPRIITEGNTVKRLMFGINLNPDEAFNFLEKGPPLDDYQNAEDFRKFWGHLASDRRFRDGSTNVAVHFKSNTIKAKRNIVKKIIQFVLEEKLELKYKTLYNEFEDILISKKVVPSYPSGTNEETCLKIILAANELGKMLRELNIPLKITGVQAVSDVFAYSEVFPPIPSNFKVISNFTTIQGNNIAFKPDKKLGLVPRYVQPIESVLHLEHSSKWPNNLEALSHIKTSFYLQISKLLKENHALLTYPCREYLDVFFEGVVFRYRLFIPKEVGLLKKVDSEEGLTSFRESEESLNLEISLNILPKIMGALKGVQSLHPSYGPGTCLIKRWLRAHLIDAYHIPDIVINLLSASLYLNTNLLPVTPQILFLRFLKFISELDWKLQLIIVNFNSDLSNKEISEVESKIQNNRNSYPNLFILTPYDQSLSVFTKNSPSKEIINRMKILASESLAFLNRIVIDQDQVGVKELFIPNYDGYNALIHLRPLLNPKRHEQITFSKVDNRIVIEKYEKSAEDKIPIVDFDPVREYLRELRKNYGKYAVFFHDSYGGNVIGVLWYPMVFETPDFKVGRVNAGKIVDGKVIFNVDAVIEDFFVMGKDLVKTIEKCNVKE